MTDWGDVVARARGLSGRLLGKPQWRSLCLSRDLGALSTQLSSLGCIAAPPAELVVSPRQLELAIRRRAGARLRLLAHWADTRAAGLAPLIDDEDRRSLRAIVRGAAAGIPPEDRLSSLIPTQALPIRALEQLARATDIAAISAQLVTWHHPYATGFAIEAQRQHPDLFRLDVAMTRAFAQRAAEVARRIDDPMRAFVRRTIDIENLWSAIALAEGAPDVDAGSLFVPGGELLRADDLLAAAASRVPTSAALRSRLTGTPLAAAVEPGKRPREDRALDALVVEFRRIALREPLSTAPIISFALRQRLEVRVLLAVTWGLALGASHKVIEDAVGVAA